MNRYSLSHLADRPLLDGLRKLVANDRITTAAMLAHIAAVDVRGLYRPAAYPSMFEYCVRELGLSEDAARKRINAARTARALPELFAAIEDGRLHLAGLLVLGPHLNPGCVADLIQAAAHKTRAEIEKLIAERFPREAMPDRLQPPSPPALELAKQSEAGAEPATCDQRAPGRVNHTPLARVAPLAAETYALQVTITQPTHDKLKRARALLGHTASAGQLADVLDRALDALLAELEKRKFAASDRPRASRGGRGSRAIPAAVRRAVRERDGEQCTFVSASGRRCCARERLEFDHIVPVARGGTSTPDNLRLRCRAHNQFEAERSFGASFMAGKRQRAMRGADSPATPAGPPTPAEPSTPAVPPTPMCRPVGLAS